MLTGERLSKTYGRQEVLREVSLDVKPGEITAILGPSGAGKSTLLRILCALEAPDSGRVVLKGREIFRQPGFKGPWPAVTLVFQQQFLWPHMSMEQNISFACRQRANSVAPVNELLEALDLLELREKRPWQLSQGERARAAFVRGLLLQPDVLLLDEVTAALDSKRANVVGELIRTFARSGGAAVFVTHDLAFAARWADVNLRLEAGVLAQTSLEWELGSEVRRAAVPA